MSHCVGFTLFITVQVGPTEFSTVVAVAWEVGKVIQSWCFYPWLTSLYAKYPGTETLTPSCSTMHPLESECV